jgi:hypothetical protein
MHCDPFDFGCFSPARVQDAPRGQCTSARSSRVGGFIRRSSRAGAFGDQVRQQVIATLGRLDRGSGDDDVKHGRTDADQTGREPRNPRMTPKRQKSGSINGSKK